MTVVASKTYLCSSSFVNLGYKGIEKVLFINRTKIVGECQDGIYGEYLNNCQNKNSISFNRTDLQHWLYNEARIVNNPVVWILDDDIRMDYLTDEGSKLKLQPKDVIFEIDRVRGEGYDIALGPITGDPPIPGICMLRCQLLDFLFYLRLIEKYGIKRSLSKLHKFPNQSQDYHDFYYDLSEFRFDHLEQPFVNIHVLKDQKELLADRFHKVIKGKASFRPVFLSISDHQNVAKNPVRGANSFIFNLESLRNFPNISPIINGITARRSDSLWLTLNKYVQNMKIGSIDVPIRHERNFDKIHSLEKLAGDIYGSSFVKAINSFFQNHLPLQTKKCFQNEENRKKILRLFEFFLKRRIGNFVLTTYRIRGLIKIIKNVIHDSEGFSTVGRDINKLNELFIQLNIDNFVNEVAQYNPQDIIRFLEQMEENSSAYRSGFGD